MAFPWIKRDLHLWLEDYIFRSHHFLAEVTFKYYILIIYYYLQFKATRFALTYGTVSEKLPHGTPPPPPPFITGQKLLVFFYPRGFICRWCQNNVWSLVIIYFFSQNNRPTLDWKFKNDWTKRMQKVVKKMFYLPKLKEIWMKKMNGSFLIN